MISQERQILHGINFMESYKEVKLTETVEKWLPGTREWRNREMLVKGYKLSVTC